MPAGGGCGRALVADQVGRASGVMSLWVVVVLLWVSPIWFWLALLAL